jgi:RimJ/RimL family protein N-acetyltransferase
MFPVLEEPALYTYTGGKPPASRDDVEAWFLALESRQSPDGLEAWLTWIIELTSGREAIGYVQATVTGGRADLAWLIGTPWQGQGYAGEAATALVVWLLDNRVSEITAHVHPGHVASHRVALSAGLKRSGVVSDGEEVWAL